MSAPAPDPRPPAAPPLRSAEHPVFRQTFLALYPPDEAETLRRGGIALWQAAVAQGASGSGEPPTVARLRAAGRELALVADFLADVAADAAAHELAPAEARLARRADRLARHVDRLARDLDRRTSGSWP